MNDKFHIDDLLKKELGDFHPEPPPQAWEQISSNIPVVEAAKTIALSTAKAWIVGVALSTALAGAALTYLYSGGSTTNTPSAGSTNEPSLAIQTAPASSDGTFTPPSGSTLHTPETASIQKFNAAIEKGRLYQTEKVKNQQGSSETTPLTNDGVLLNTFSNTKTESHADNYLPLADKKENTPTVSVGNDGQTVVTREQEEEFADYTKPVIPNVFTPNGDGYNDNYVITLEHEILFELKILDRKGQIVFESKDKNFHWNGTLHNMGAPCESGVYVFALRYQTKNMKEPKVEQGKILLKL